MTTQEQIAVMQAYADGKKIQWNSPVDQQIAWIDTDEPLWNWCTCTYRVKPEPVLLKTWEEYAGEHIIQNGSSLVLNFPDDKQELMKAFSALYKLIRLRDCYNDGWMPDWADDTIKHTIGFPKNELWKGRCVYCSAVLAFKTEELRNEFYGNFKDLIEIAKPLL